MSQAPLLPVLRTTTCCLALSLFAGCASKPGPLATPPELETSAPALPAALSQDFDTAAKNYAQVIDVAPGFKLAANKVKGTKENAEGKIIAARASGDFLLFAPEIPLRAVASEIEIADGIAHLSGSPVAVQGSAAQASVTGTRETEFHISPDRLSTSGPTTTRITKALEPPPSPPSRAARPSAPPTPKVTKPARPTLPKMRLPSDEAIPLPAPSAG